jgi:5-methylcytosine-specific restriction endonuclease McrA
MNKTTRKTVHDKCGGNCAYCGDTLGKRWTVDHVISQRNFLTTIKNKFRVPKFLEHLTEFDVNHIDNLLPACQSCNNYKSAEDIETFRSEIGKLLDRLQKYSTQFKIATRFGLVRKSKKDIVFYFEKIKLYERAPDVTTTTTKPPKIKVPKKKRFFKPGKFKAVKLDPNDPKVETMIEQTLKAQEETRKRQRIDPDLGHLIVGGPTVVPN